MVHGMVYLFTVLISYKSKVNGTCVHTLRFYAVLRDTYIVKCINVH